MVLVEMRHVVPTEPHSVVLVEMRRVVPTEPHSAMLVEMRRVLPVVCCLVCSVVLVRMTRH